MSDVPLRRFTSSAFTPDIERARLQAIVNKDMELADSLHADDYELITPGGRAMSKEQYLGGVASGALNYVVFEPASDIAVREYGRAAIVRYRARIEMHLDGAVDSDLFWHTDLYEVRDGRWQAVWSHATRIKR